MKWTIKVIDLDAKLTNSYQMNQFDKIKPFVANGLRKLVNKIAHIDRQNLLLTSDLLCQIIISNEKVVNIQFGFQNQQQLKTIKYYHYQWQGLLVVKDFDDLKTNVIRNLIALVNIINYCNNLQNYNQQKWNLEWIIIGNRFHPYDNDFYTLQLKASKKFAKISVLDHWLNNGFQWNVKTNQSENEHQFATKLQNRWISWSNCIQAIKKGFKRSILIVNYDQYSAVYDQDLGLQINLNYHQLLKIDWKNLVQNQNLWWFKTSLNN